MKCIEQNEYLTNIAYAWIESEPILSELKEFGVSVIVLSSDESKKLDNGTKRILGQCIKVTDDYKWCCPVDFMIKIYEQNIIDLTKEQLQILVLHELLHIGIDTEGVEPKFFVKHHDVEEFDHIIEKYGAHWEQQRGC